MEYYYYIPGLKQSLVNTQDTRGYLAWIIGNGDPMHDVSDTGYLPHENSKGEIRGRSKHKNQSKRVV